MVYNVSGLMMTMRMMMTAIFYVHGKWRSQATAAASKIEGIHIIAVIYIDVSVVVVVCSASGVGSTCYCGCDGDIDGGVEFMWLQQSTVRRAGDVSALIRSTIGRI